MARNEGEDDSVAGDVRAPFLFVPHCETPSAAWLADHPDWIETPATFVTVPNISYPTQTTRSS